MLITIPNIKSFNKKLFGTITLVLFILLSILLYSNDNEWLSFGMGIIGCFSVVLIFSNCEKNRFFSWLSKYTFPIFLMHTLFAAPVRVLLIKIGISNAAIHIVTGITVSMIGPIIIMNLLMKIKLDWMVYPGNLLKEKTK